MTHLSTDAVLSKTRTQVASIAAGCSGANLSWLGGVVAACFQVNGREGRQRTLFSISFTKYAALVRSGALALELGSVTSHLFRHGGASFDAVCGASHEAIRFRGQWRHPNSCSRYMKFWKVHSSKGWPIAPAPCPLRRGRIRPQASPCEGNIGRSSIGWCLILFEVEDTLEVFRKVSEE